MNSNTKTFKSRMNFGTFGWEERAFGFHYGTALKILLIYATVHWRWEHVKAMLSNWTRFVCDGVLASALNLR